MKTNLTYDKLKGAFENELKLSLQELSTYTDKVSSDFVRYFDTYGAEILIFNKYVKLLKAFLNVLTKDYFEEQIKLEYKINIKRLVYRSNVSSSTSDNFISSSLLSFRSLEVPTTTPLDQLSLLILIAVGMKYEDFPLRITILIVYTLLLLFALVSRYKDMLAMRCKFLLHDICTIFVQDLAKIDIFLQKEWRRSIFF